jgi:hypothetical protein
MTNQHPITPPPELERQWSTKYIETPCSFADLVNEVARWGADQELEACCALLLQEGAWPWPEEVASLRAARRPKQPSLKEQALARLAELESDEPGYEDDLEVLRRALEALPND